MLTLTATTPNRRPTTHLLTGDARTISAGTLQIGNGGTTGSIGGDIANNGALIFNRSDALTYGGVISGTGSMAKLGAGTLTLTGDNTFTGGTTISDGALQIGNGGTTGSISGDIADNAALIFNRSDALTYGGVISGTGSMTKIGAGTLTLTGDNTYTGGTTISAGTLILTGDNTSNATISAGTLQIGDGGTTGSISGNITNNSALIFDRSGALTYGGVISGTGSMSQARRGNAEPDRRQHLHRRHDDRRRHAGGERFDRGIW